MRISIALPAFLILVISLFTIGAIYLISTSQNETNKKYPYRVIQDGRVYRTDKYTKDGNCIEFLNSDGDSTTVCGTFQINKY